MGFLLWALFVYGVTLTVTGATITAGLRRRLKVGLPWVGKLVSCPMCFGWWVGLAVGLVGVPPSPSGNPLMDAFASMSVCWIAHVVLTRLGAEKLWAKQRTARPSHDRSV